MGLLYLFALFSLISGNDGTLDMTALSQQVNCTDPQSILVSGQKCLDEYNIPLKLPSIANFSVLPKLITPAYLADICRNVDAYEKTQVCTETILAKCNTSTPLTRADYKKIQEYVCANLDKFNITCMFEMVSKIGDCSSTYNYLTTSDFNKLNFAEFNHKATCMTEKMSSICVRKYLPACGQVALHIFNAYQPNNTECLTPNSFDTPTVDCSTTDNIRSSYHQCFIYNGIPFQFPENLTSEDTSQHIMRAITMDDNMCSNLKDYQQAVNCTLQVQKQCSDDAMKPTVADSKTVQDGLAKLCGHIGDFDTKCVQNTPKGTCRSRRPALDPKHLCAATSATQNCLVSAVSSCSKTTVSMFKVVLLSQSPSMCLKQATGSPLIG
ncbi:uncharacterized protein LOC124258171 isoform X2 [Haliotis rubra]|uniref:uncharacterized protein LOC124258171 isoform X2 n=1 Tax=Haliotis rubra TaxID=36100 RepID=UPI001EE56FBD|nr:uncharacterized protein LOC124258171 isoform X2 [Haliotis rubra]